MKAKFVAFLLIAALVVNGCTLIGYSVGSVVDYDHSGRELVDEWSQLKRGDELYLILNSGQSRTGEYLGKPSQDSLRFRLQRPVYPRVPDQPEQVEASIAIKDINLIYLDLHPTTGRVGGTIMGLMLDISLYFLTVYITSSLSAIESMGA